MSFILAILLLALTGGAAQPVLPVDGYFADAAPVTTARAVLGQVIGDTTTNEVLDGPPPGQHGYPYVTAGGYLSQSAAPDLGVSVEVFDTPRDLANRMIILNKVAPEDRYYSGSSSAGSVLLSVGGWVSDAQAAMYAERFSLALLVLQ